MKHVSTLLHHTCHSEFYLKGIIGSVCHSIHQLSHCLQVPEYADSVWAETGPQLFLIILYLQKQAMQLVEDGFVLLKLEPVGLDMITEWNGGEWIVVSTSSCSVRNCGSQN